MPIDRAPGRNLLRVMLTVDTRACGHCQNQTHSWKRIAPPPKAIAFGSRSRQAIENAMQIGVTPMGFLCLIERASFERPLLTRSSAQDSKAARGVILLVERHPLGTKHPVASAKRSLWPSERGLLTGKFAQQQGLRELTLRPRSHPSIRHNPARS